MTPIERNALQQCLDALLAWEKWEAGILNDDQCWQTTSGCPLVTQPHLDSLSPVQIRRNSAVAMARKMLEPELPHAH